jgi:hypothetical protein
MAVSVGRPATCACRIATAKRARKSPFAAGWKLAAAMAAACLEATQLVNATMVSLVKLAMCALVE